MVKRELELHRLNTHSDNRVLHAVGRFTEHCFSYGGHVGVHLIIGGYDARGPQLLEVSSDGHSKHAPFLTTGSGSLAAMGIMETEYKEDMTQDEAIALVSKAIEAGIAAADAGKLTDLVTVKAKWAGREERSRTE